MNANDRPFGAGWLLLLLLQLQGLQGRRQPDAKQVSKIADNRNHEEDQYDPTNGVPAVGHRL